MGNERFRASFDFFKAKLTTALSIPENPSRRKFLRNTSLTLGALTLNPLEQLAKYRPLVIVYADGLGGKSPEGRAFYKAVDIFTNWKTAEARNPEDPTIEEWKTTIYNKLIETDSEGSDIDLVGHSAGGAVIVSLALDMLNPSTRFYNTQLAEKIVSLTLLAPPNTLDPNSTTRPAIDGKNEYKKLFKRYPSENIQDFIRVFSDKTTIVVAENDEPRLRAEGIAMANTLQTSLKIVAGGHGMEGATTVIRDLFRERYIKHRINQSKMSV